MRVLRSIPSVLGALASLAALTAPAMASDIVQLEAFFHHAAPIAQLQFCREPFYPPGDCRPARFTEGVRYNWLHSSDAVSNERLSLIHDEARSGQTAIFHSTIPGYGPMRFAAPSEEVWCMPDARLDLPTRYYARIAGFREHEEDGDARIAAQYGLYVVLDSEAGCEALLQTARERLR